MTDKDVASDKDEVTSVDDELDETAAFRVDTTTENLSEKTKEALGGDISERLLFEPGAILFYFSGSNEPHLIQDASKIIVGRQSDVEPPETPFDLTSENAVERGVSRRHAAIHITPEGYSIEDLKSTNGTWLNGQRIDPFTRYLMHSGDRVRFGELAVNVYFSEQKVQIQTIHLGNIFQEETQNVSFTPGYLSDEVATYIQALSGLQHAIDDALAKEESAAEDAQIFSIRLNNRQSKIVVEIANTTDAIHLTRDLIELTKQHHKDDLSEVRQQVQESISQATNTRILSALYEHKPHIFPKIIETILQMVMEDIQNELEPNPPATTQLKTCCFTLLISPIQLNVHAGS